MLVDVLHHSNNIREILAETSWVSRHFLLIEDHLSESPLDFYSLKFTDWIGNRPHVVFLPNNYQSHSQWDAYEWQDQIPIYRFPFSRMFGSVSHRLDLPIAITALRSPSGAEGAIPRLSAGWLAGLTA